MGKLPTTIIRRPSALTPCTTSSRTPSTPSALRSSTSPCAHQYQHQQTRHATFIPRSRRPYQFTQLVQLSDGSTYTVRTTSPAALYKAAKDSRNHILWQPSEKSLRNVELDEAGKLAAFRERFGRGWDLASPPTEGAAEAVAAAAPVAAGKVEGGKKEVVQEAAVVEDDPFESLEDLITGYAATSEGKGGGLSAKEQAKMDKKKKK